MDIFCCIAIPATLKSLVTLNSDAGNGTLVGFHGSLVNPSRGPHCRCKVSRVHHCLYVSHNYTRFCVRGASGSVKNAAALTPAKS